MTPRKFRQLALSLPETTEHEHMNHPDFRVGGKVFASLFPDDGWGVIKLTPELQTELLEAQPDVYEPCKGAWGRAGATIVTLEDAEEGRVLKALIAAWRRHAPRSLIEEFDSGNR